jgi:hypothetical protein
MDKSSQLFDIFDSVAFKKFKKSVHRKSLSVRVKCLRVAKDNLVPGSENMYLAYPPEVIAVYGKGDGQGKQPRFAHQRPGH